MCSDAHPTFQVDFFDTECKSTFLNSFFNSVLLMWDRITAVSVWDRIRVGQQNYVSRDAVTYALPWNHLSTSSARSGGGGGGGRGGIRGGGSIVGSSSRGGSVRGGAAGWQWRKRLRRRRWQYCQRFIH